MNLNQLLFLHANFYGVENTVFCIGVNGKKYAFEVREDENDGYRSMMADAIQVPVSSHTFFRKPVAVVRIEQDTNLRGGDNSLHHHVAGVYSGGYSEYGFKFVDIKTGHVWLRFGTDDTDDYYPMFVFEYTPDKSNTINVT